MNRKEAKNFEKHKLVFKQSQIPFLRHIDKIYDDFESRTCGNCKYFTIEFQKEGSCDMGTGFPIDIDGVIENYVAVDFSCNRWETKDGKQ